MDTREKTHYESLLKQYGFGNMVGDADLFDVLEVENFADNGLDRLERQNVEDGPEVDNLTTLLAKAERYMDRLVNDGQAEQVEIRIAKAHRRLRADPSYVSLSV